MTQNRQRKPQQRNLASSKPATPSGLSKLASQQAPPRKEAERRQTQERPWLVAARLVLVILLVVGMIGSLFLGFCAQQSYALEARQPDLLEIQPPQVLDALGQQPQALDAAALTSLIPSNATARATTRTTLGELLPGDRIDGRPAEGFAGLTSDYPEVESPLAGLCTKDGRLLFERSIDTKVPMASTTKMMTALIALETTALDTPLKVTWGAANTDGTSAGLVEDMTISLLDCLYALMLPSGNDAAVVIAQNIADLESRFVERMNARAAELGMSSTHYSDASGLTEENHYSTVRDYLLLARYCMTNPTFRQIVGTKHYEALVDGRPMTFTSTSLLSDYLVDAQALGIKTGSNVESGYCYVGCATYNGVELYTVVFNSETNEQRFADTASMLEWGFRHYRTIELINPTQQVANVAMTSWLNTTVSAFVPVAVRVELFDLGGPIAQDILVDSIDGAAVEGERCGQIIWSQNGEVLTTSEVVIGESVRGPDFWEGVGLWWTRFFGGFWGDPAHASSSILLKSELAVPAAPVRS